MADSALISTLRKRRVNPMAIKKVDMLLDFLEKHGITFYDAEWPKIRERSEGSKQFIDITVSIRTCGEVKAEK